MTYILFAGLGCGLVALFFLFWAGENLVYPRSHTTVEAYPTDQRPSRRWFGIVLKGGLGLALVALAAYLCIDLFYAEKKREDAVLLVQELFNTKQGRVPSSIQFEDNRAISR